MTSVTKRATRIASTLTFLLVVSKQKRDSQGALLSYPHTKGFKIFFQIISIIRRTWTFKKIPFADIVGVQTGLIRVKEEGWTGFYEVWQDSSKGFSEGKAGGKS